MPATNDLDTLLEDAADAMDAGVPEKALEASDAALKLAPGHAESLLLKYEALWALERDAEAKKTLDLALKKHPTALDVLMTAAAHAVENEAEDLDAQRAALELVRRGIKLAVKGKDPSTEGQLEQLHGRLLSGLEDLAGAHAAYDRALMLIGSEEDDELAVDVAVGRFELLKLDGAAELLRKVLGRTPDHAGAHHFLGRVLERQGDKPLAEKHFSLATRHDPVTFPPPYRLSRKEFDSAIADVLETLPEEVQEALKEVPVMVEDLPRDEDLRGDPPLSPMSVGMFRGGSVHTAGQVSGALPSSIILYQRNLERDAADREELLEEIEITLLHEIGHYMGWDEEDLHHRGLH